MHWKSQIEGFDGIVLVFDEFEEECADKIKFRIEWLQTICNA